MARIQLTLPEHFEFSSQHTVRVTDLNYGNHLGNDRLLALLHQARVEYIIYLGANSELDFFGTSLIMADVGIQFKAEAFLNDTLTIAVAHTNISRVGFELYYKVTRGETLIATAKTGMVCFDYKAKKISPVPQLLKD